MDKIRDLLNM